MQEREEIDGFDGFIERNKNILLFLAVGVLLIGVGLLGFKFYDLFSDQPKVEILGEEEGSGTMDIGSGDKVSEARRITAEISGEVQKPGVYELDFGTRVNDLLIVAGGFSAEADREWVAKNVNLAQKLQDGGKIYIPSKSQNSNLKAQSQNTVSQVVAEKININTASEKELDGLWGIGEATVKKIIENRPYQRPEELLEKKIIKRNVWEEIKDQISVW